MNLNSSAKIIKIDETEPDPQLIAEAADYLAAGKVVVIPTETVYGIAVNAAIPDSLAKIYAIKKRDAGKPVSYHHASLERFLKYAGDGLDDSQRSWFERIMPNPVTIVYYDSLREKKIGVRIPQNKVASEIINKLNQPVFASSVNYSGEKSAVKIEDIDSDLFVHFDLVVDSGPAEKSFESTVIDISSGEPVILRQGAYKL